MPTRHLIIKGKVQGVFFRASVKDVAERLGIVGWVKNTIEGHVELLVTGSDEQLEDLAIWCRRGPSNARVIEILIEDKPEQMFHGFSIRK